MKRLLLVILAVAVTGCAFHTRSTKRVTGKLEEESRTLTTAVVDALTLSTNREPAVNVALDLARQDQRIEGLPVDPVDVRPLIEGNAKAIAALQRRFSEQDTLLRELVRHQESLLALGEQAEKERARSWWRRIFGGVSVVTLLGGLVALMVFFPPAIAIIGRIIGWLVGKLPAIASFVGVVSVKAFDATVQGVERAKGIMAEDDVGRLEVSLSQAMDRPHKDLVRARKAVVG